MILVDEPSLYTEDETWPHLFGELSSFRTEQWGELKTLRAFYANGLELEFNFATPAWAAAPLEAGTRQVLKGGYRVLFDRSGRISKELKAALG